MKRALFAAAALAPMIEAAYACRSDSFQNGDASPEAGGGVTQADFCDAEALYLHQCGFEDAACAQADLKNCGTYYAAVTNALASAITFCIDKGQLPCTSDLGKAIVSPCVAGQLSGYQNDSGELANFANDFCNRCQKSNPTCVSTFASAPQPGYIPSLFDDSVIKVMDECEKKLDGGVLTSADASFDCLGQSLLCEYIAIGLTTPASTCTDR